MNNHNCEKLKLLVSSAAMYIAVALKQSLPSPETSNKQSILKKDTPEIANLHRVSLPSILDCWRGEGVNIFFLQMIQMLTYVWRGFISVLFF